MSGMVYLVGAGPGDPGLITVKGRECIRRADVLVYDYLANEQLLAEAAPGCERVYVGKQAGAHSLPQDEINQLLVDLARKHDVVTRLKGGDPFIFGRGGEEAELLAAEGIAFEIVPGITAGIAGPAYAGIPATHRGLTSTVTFITGHERAGATADGIPWKALAGLKGTLVFYMGVGNLPHIVERLTAEGLDPATPAALVEWATYPRQRTVTGTLENLEAVAAEAGIKPPALIVIGAVTELRATLDWFERKPLFGRRIVVTRSRTQASSLLSQLAELGADAIEFPTIRIEPAAEPEPLRAAARRAGEYDWTIFTSANAVAQFMATLKELALDVRALGTARLAAIGPATRQALEDCGLRVDVTPRRYVAEEMLEALREFGDLAGKRFLIPRADIARDVLPDGLRAAGAEVDVVTAYRTVLERPENCDALIEDLDAGRIDAVTFSSSSTAQNFAELIGLERFKTLSDNCCLASIGPITSDTIRELGPSPTLEAETYTIPGLLAALQKHFAPPA